MNKCKKYFQVIRHEKLNRPYSPCEPSPDYNLGHCVEKSVMRKIGCQPQWRRVNISGLPICDNGTMLDKFAHKYKNAVEYGKNAIKKRTNCLVPCTFMEYKVTMLSASQNNTVYLQIPETPVVLNKNIKNGVQGFKEVGNI